MKGKGRIVLAAVLLLGLMLLSACVGSFPLTLSQIGAILRGAAPDTIEFRVFWQLRIPRVIMGAAAGAALSLAGSVYQTVFRNPLASPDLTGVASGASFGAACAIVLGGGAGQVMLSSFSMGMLSLLLVLLLVRSTGMEQLSSYILAGIIVSSLADAGLMCLKIMADPERELAALEFWTMGSLGSTTASRLFPQLIFVVAPFVLLLLFHKQIVLLSLGADHARSLGLSPGLWRGILLSLSTLMIASLVSLTGVIAFVGLIAPHIAFLMYSRRDFWYFLLSSLIGADLLLISDMLARSLWKGAELPLSILTVFLAVPALIFLLKRKRGGRYGTLA